MPYEGDGIASGTSVDKESRPWITHCNECLGEHAPNDVCPNWQCGICYKTNHTNYCPYFHHIPQGALYNREMYYIVCECYKDFDEVRWACTYCGGTRAMLRKKICVICYLLGHNGYECSVDKVRAAELKMARDERLGILTQQLQSMDEAFPLVGIVGDA